MLSKKIKERLVLCLEAPLLPEEYEVKEYRGIYNLKCEGYMIGSIIEVKREDIPGLKVDLKLLQVAHYPMRSKFKEVKEDELGVRVDYYDYKLPRVAENIFYFVNDEFFWAECCELKLKVAEMPWGIKYNIAIQGEAEIRQYFNSDEGQSIGGLLICKSNEARGKRIERKYKDELDRIDKYMDAVPELPKDIDIFVERTVLKDHKFVFYRKAKSSKESNWGYCSACKGEVVPKNPVHNWVGVCPSCKKRIVYKAEKKQKQLQGSEYFYVVSNTDKGPCLRHFSAVVRFNGRDERVWIHEFRRVFLRDKRIFEWGDFHQRGIRWCSDHGNYYQREVGYIYTRNLKKSLYGTEYQYSAIYEMAIGYGQKFDVTSYLERYKRFKGLEYLVKMGLYEMAADCLELGCSSNFINFEGRNIQEVLGVPKQYVGLIKEAKFNYYKLGFLQKYIKSNKNFTKSDFLAIKGIVIGGASVENLAYVCRYMTVLKAKNYLNKQVKFFADKNITNVLQLWKDYITMGLKISDVWELFPSNINKAHAEAVVMVKKIRDEDINKLLKKTFEEIKGLEYEGKKYIIKAPTSVEDIVEEGNTLHHCVGKAGYVEKMKNNESYILFLREKERPDVSFYTIEIDLDNWEVLQCRGKYNRGYNDEIKVFLNKWVAEIIRIQRMEIKKVQVKVA